MEFNWYLSWYKDFFGIEAVSYILNSTEQMVYESVCDQKRLFFTGMQLVYGIIIYV